MDITQPYNNIYIYKNPNKQNTTNIRRYNKPRPNSSYEREDYHWKPVTELGRTVLCKHLQDSGSNDSAWPRKSFNFLVKVLHYFGYWPEIIQKIKTVYQNIETEVKVNGHLSQTFLVKRWLWQRSLLSMVLYIIGITIKGITIDEKELKTSAFADDTIMFYIYT